MCHLQTTFYNNKKASGPDSDLIYISATADCNGVALALHNRDWNQALAVGI